MKPELIVRPVDSATDRDGFLNVEYGDPEQGEVFLLRMKADAAGDLWFVALDVCSALGHLNPHQSLADNVEKDDLRTAEVTDSLGRRQKSNLISEVGMYRLAFASRLSGAKRFAQFAANLIRDYRRGIIDGMRTGASVERDVTSQSIISRADAMLLNAKTRMHRELMRSIDEINQATPLAPEVMSATKASILESTIGRLLPALKPKTSVEWFTPTQIAEQLGVTANRIGLVVTELAIRGNVDGLARAVVNKSANSDKTVTSYQYTATAVDLMRARLAEQGHIPNPSSASDTPQ